MMILLIIIMSFLFSVAMFRGLEYHPSYFGNAYQAIYPASFPHDPFMNPSRPTMFSFYYLLVKWVGPLWLDDRFTILVFIGIAMVSLVGIDKTARLLGANHFGERATILSLMLLEHRFMANHALFLDNYDFHPTAMACPVIIWLLYHSLAGSHSLMIVSLMVGAFLVSPKTASLPIMLSLALWWWRLDSHGKKVTGIIALVFAGAALGIYYLFVRHTDPNQAALFDYILLNTENTEANPFWDTWMANLFFVGLCGAGFLIRELPAAILPRVRAVAGLGLVVWFFGGLYLTYAPNAIKIPYVVPLDVTRALWWVQYVLYLAIGVALLKQLQNASSWGKIGVTWGFLLVLYLLHIEFRTKLLVMVLVVTAVMLWSHFRKHRFDLLSQSARLRIVAISFCVGTLSLYGIGSIHHRWAALKFLAHHGIIGDNGGAQWVGVNEYIRSTTSPSATIFALSRKVAQAGKGELGFDGSLRTRTGRSMPIGHRIAFQFDYQKLMWLETQEEHLASLKQAWREHNLEGLSRALSALGSPDYLVIPTGDAQWLRDVPSFNYMTETTVGNFMIFRKYLRSR